MNIEKKTEIICQTDEGETLNCGDTVIFKAEGKNIVGMFEGLTPKGAVEFKSLYDSDNTTYAYMPRSVHDIFKVQVCFTKADSSED